jgi:hypothetical protein
VEIIGCWLTSGDGSFLEESVLSVLDVVDRLVVAAVSITTECADVHQGAAVPAGVLKLLQSIRASGKPVRILRPQGWRTPAEARNACLKLVDSSRHVVFELDADEVYGGRIRELRRILASHDAGRVFVPAALYFWKTTYRVNHAIRDYQPRIYRQIPGLYYETDGDSYERPYDVFGEAVLASPRYPSVALTEVVRYDYEAAVGWRRYFAKLLGRYRWLHPEWSEEALADMVLQHSYFTGEGTDIGERGEDPRHHVR